MVQDTTKSKKATKSSKGWLVILLAIVGVLVIAGGTVYFFFPSVLLDMVKARYERQAKVTDKVAVVDGYKVPYYEGGKGETIVLIHGFGDRKLSFVQVAAFLTPHYRVILPEVPGFGDTKRDKKRDYSIKAQVETFHKLFKQLGLNRFYLGGNSMGGHISAAYALAYPQQVKKLILFNAAGLHVPNTKKPYQPSKKPMDGKKDFDQYMRKIFYKIPTIPRPIEAFLIKRSRHSFAWNNHMSAAIRGGKDYLLNDRIAQVTIPTLVLWGDHDRIVKPNVGEMYHAKLPNSTWVMMKLCGHSPQYERPKEAAGHILRFVQTTHKTTTAKAAAKPAAPAPTAPIAPTAPTPTKAPEATKAAARQP